MIPLAVGSLPLTCIISTECSLGTGFGSSITWRWQELLKGELSPRLDSCGRVVLQCFEIVVGGKVVAQEEQSEDTRMGMAFHESRRKSGTFLLRTMYVTANVDPNQPSTPVQVKRVHGCCEAVTLLVALYLNCRHPSA